MKLGNSTGLNDEVAPHTLSQDTPNNVTRSAGTKRDDQNHWSQRVGLSQCEARDGCEPENACGYVEELPTN